MVRPRRHRRQPARHPRGHHRDRGGADAEGLGRRSQLRQVPPQGRWSASGRADRGRCPHRRDALVDGGVLPTAAGGSTDRSADNNTSRASRLESRRTSGNDTVDAGVLGRSRSSHRHRPRPTSPSWAGGSMCTRIEQCLRPTGTRAVRARAPPRYGEPWRASAQHR